MEKIIIEGMPLTVHIMEIRRTVSRNEQMLYWIKSVLFKMMEADISKQISEGVDGIVSNIEDIAYMLAKAWAPDTYYRAGEIVSNEKGIYYLVTANHTSSADVHPEAEGDESEEASAEQPLAAMVQDSMVVLPYRRISPVFTIDPLDTKKEESISEDVS